MVTTPHVLASEAGAKVLQAGGTAIEAVVAAGAVLSVVYPHFCGLGGDAVWLVADGDGAATCFLGIGQAAEMLPDFGADEAISVRGPLSMLTGAGLVDSWRCVLEHSAARWAGRLTLPALLDDAISLAADGFDASSSQAFWHGFRAREAADWPGFSQTFVARGLQRQPALARSLDQIARNGARDAYEGELAASLAKGLAAAGSPLTARDLARTRTREGPPLSLAYRDHRLLAPPPPTQGVTTLAIMGILRELGPSPAGIEGADLYHRLVEAVKQAFLDRGGIGDPDFETVSPAECLDPIRLAMKAAAIDPARATSWPHRFQTGDTAFLGAVDAKGRCVSMLQSTYFDWGSGWLVGDTGILWHNRGAAFSLDRGSANALQPGKRPFYTLNPGIALRNGRPSLLYGTQGADGQPQTLSLLLSLIIDRGLDPLAALSQPRFLLGRTFSDSRDTLKIEANAGATVVRDLAARGHDISTIESFSPLGGQAGIIHIAADGSIAGAHDPRSDGCAIGVGS
ncbi:gamma-glutamyltransferase [Aureimonas sp. Leaf454]|uniref:gamma-glutamyltransferase family protein n=1 Tax=Aureimonas sp. Leaf454 TaxID=1736381 RepID=UPI0006FADE1E|nr:gamma-glutamyltransferase [Aureimonas sp. Leaf454]KQT54953.1 gamma-glutamyltransferase [Aureimonas sp. Leaf454]